jgi:hypothetical protein
MNFSVQKMLNDMSKRLDQEKEKEDLTVPSGPAAQLTDHDLYNALDMTGKGHVNSVLNDAVNSASLFHAPILAHTGHNGWTRAEIVNVTSRLYEQLPYTKKVLLENKYCYDSVTYENPVFQQMAFLIYHIRQW